MANHSKILVWRIHGQRSLAGYSSWGLKELDMTKQLFFFFFLDANDITCDEWILLAFQTIKGSGES